MSSKLIRQAEIAQQNAEPIRWRQYGQSHSCTPPTVLARASPEPATADGEALKQARAAGYQQGVAAGEATGAQKAQARLEPAFASFSSIVTELEAARKTLRIEAEQAAVALALEVARRVLHREVASDPEAILGLVKAAFQKADAKETRRLRLSPEDSETIRENRSRLNLPQGIEITADRTLPRGSAIFETSRGELDVSVDTQLAEIERGLADVLKRRRA